MYKTEVTQILAIRPYTGFIQSCRQGTLNDVDVEFITERLGFAPDQEVLCDKITCEWAFTVGDKQFVIWDYKGSAARGQFSTFGDHSVLGEIFGDNYTVGCR